MKNPIRALYDKLPITTRSAIRSVLPGELLRWYAHKNTDVYLVSYPKCGRTWLRLLIGRTIANYYGLPKTEDILFLNWKGRVHPDIPRITVIHEDRPMLKAPEELAHSKERYRHKQVIFLARDPRDVIISSYFEMSKRGRLFGDNPHESRQPIFEGELSEFIHRQTGGFDTILEYYNIWAENRHIPKGFLLIRYEDLKTNTQRELRRALDFLGLTAVDDETCREAVAFASFENMRKMEKQGKFQSGILKPADKTDQDSYKTRQGKVGGYKEYLTKDEASNLDEKVRSKLNQIYMYE